jgi:hypothetical protein
MTTKTISTTVSSYDISSPVTTLSITSTGYIKGTGADGVGVYTLGSGFYTIVNDGRINGVVDGVNLRTGTGGSVSNGSDSYTSASITGVDYGVRLFGSATVNNFGSITNKNSTSFRPAAVYLANGGSVTNGSSSDTGALIEGVDGLWLSSGAGVVTNYGKVTATGGGASPGVYMSDGGALTNGGAGDSGASIRGAAAVEIKGGSGAVTNFGSITSTADQPGVSLTDGGSVANGTVLVATADIKGADGVSVLGTAGSVKNYGVIEGTAVDGWGVVLGVGGGVVNGSTGALVEGYGGISVPSGSGSVTNLGTILSVGVKAASGDAIGLKDGGVVTNGTSGDTSALIEGDVNVIGIYGAAGTVANFGTIRGDGNPWSGVYLQKSGSVTNGSGGDSTALIFGAFGVFLEAAGTVTNYGTIQGSVDQAVYLKAGGSLINGSSGDRAALISSPEGVLSRLLATVSNFGTIDASAGDAVVLDAGGRVTNGANGDTSAVIDGESGGIAILAATGTVANFGTIRGEIDHHVGVYLGAGGSVTNGSPIDSTALISGAFGVELENGGTLANFGTVRGAYRDCVILYGGGVVTNGSNVDAGAVLEGYSGVTDDAGSVSIANFGTVEGIGVAGWAGLILRGAATVTNGSLTDTGALVEGYSGVTSTVSAKITNYGTIEGVGLSGQSGISMTGGSVTNGSAKDAKALIEGYGGITTTGAATVNNFGAIDGAGGVAVQFTSAGSTLIVDGGSSFIGAADGDGGTLDLASGNETITGALSGSGVTISGGIATSTFNDFATLDIAVTATVTLSGPIAVPNVVTVSGKLLAANGTSLTGAGAIVLTDSASNEITGATATSLLTNDTRIEGEGQLGDGAMELTNAASGSIYSLGAGSLTLNTGTSTILNAGAIVSEGTGGLTISSPIDNTGELIAYSSPLTIEDAVTGTGTAEIENAATLILKGAFNENVTFASSSTGVLELGDSKGYTTGSITGFSKTGTNALDLLDIPFVSGTTTATYTGTTTSGVLTVKDGANVATIHLTGNYTTSTFTVSAGSAGGTKVVDPGGASAPPHAAAPLSPHPFIAAMAEFGAAQGAGPVAITVESERAAPIFAASTGQIT